MILIKILFAVIIFLFELTWWLMTFPWQLIRAVILTRRRNRLKPGDKIKARVVKHGLVEGIVAKVDPDRHVWFRASKGKLRLRKEGVRVHRKRVYPLKS